MVGRRGDACRPVEHRNSFAEKYDERPQQRSVGRPLVGFLLPAVDRYDERFVDAAAQLAQFSVQMQHARAAGPLVQVVDVLRDHVHVEMIFQSANGLVTCVRTASEQLAPPDVIELDDLFPVAGQCLGRADVLDAVFVPQTVRVAEGGQAAVGAHAGAGEDYDLFYGLFHGMIGLDTFGGANRAEDVSVPSQ